MKKLMFLFLLVIINSNNYGQWEYINSPNNINDLIILQSGKILAGTNQGLFTSLDMGTSWDSTSINTIVYKIKSDFVGNLYVASNSLFKSADQGLFWEECIDLYPDRIVDFSINDSNHIHLFAESNQALSVFRSKDFGTSWQVISNIFFYENSIAKAFRIANNSIGNTFISYRGYGYAPGGLWFDYRYLKRFNDQHPWLTVIEGKIILDFQFLSGVMYLATQGEGIYKSDDEGNTLILINSGLTTNNIKQIIASDEVFICLTDSGVFRSLNQGISWVSLDNTGLDLSTINRMYLSQEGRLFACTQSGIYVFTGELPVELISFTYKVYENNVILNWSTASELNNHGFEIQKKYFSGDWFTIGFKEGKGTSTNQSDYSYTDDISNINNSNLFYRLKQIDFDGTVSYSNTIEVDISGPKEFALYQNYPNPFNPVTTIKFALPFRTNSTINVYNTLGEKISEIFKGEMESGYHEVQFNATGLSSGIYFYKIESENFNSTKKMILMK
ncbi:MAG TPA: T9SS type A sorting domain-containing protein [Ignavibacteriaceae bacterium]|nr:T9SS type A sorting domain-containing protein [Ignavibacteriaceae bacterium]